LHSRWTTQPSAGYPGRQRGAAGTRAYWKYVEESDSAASCKDAAHPLAWVPGRYTLEGKLILGGDVYAKALVLGRITDSSLMIIGCSGRRIVKGFSATRESWRICQGGHHTHFSDPSPILRYQLDYFVSRAGIRGGPGRDRTMPRISAGEPLVAFSPMVPGVRGSEIMKHIDNNHVDIHEPV
jgi:hypothetical protein